MCAELSHEEQVNRSVGKAPLFLWFCVFAGNLWLLLSIFSGKSHLKLGINYIGELWRDRKGGLIDNTFMLAGMWHCVQSTGVVTWLWSKGTDRLGLVSTNLITDQLCDLRWVP